MVIVSDVENAKHGEINIVESIPKAGRLVETLLEAGFDQARIRVFAGGEMEMRVRQRPVVALIADDETSEPALDNDERVGKLTLRSETGAESPKQKVSAEPYQQNGVRFANAFRPA
jgi:hypothetical protein